MQKTAFASLLFLASCVPPGGGGGQRCANAGECPQGAACSDGRCTCVAGASRGCGCPGGGQGLQVCGADHAFGACMCESVGDGGGLPTDDASMSTDDASMPNGDGGPQPDGGADECADGETDEEACGINGNGTRLRSCVGGAWSAFGPCSDPDEMCADGDTEEVACGLNGRGLTRRECDGARWGPFDECDDPDDCVDDAEEDDGCGLNGRGVSTRQCIDGEWFQPGGCDDPDECTDGDADFGECGPNGRGREERRCDEGQWSDWVCDDGDVCEDGEMELADACGINGRGEATRQCDDGRWGPLECDDPDRCEDGDVELNPCPDGTEQDRECARGQWGLWSGCDGEQREGVVMQCGRSTRNVNDFLVGPLAGGEVEVRQGCVPVEGTLAVLVTRAAGADFRAALDPIRRFVQAGGNVVTEFTATETVYNAIFDQNVPAGDFNGGCGDNIQPAHQYNANDAFWRVNRFEPLAEGRTGCGHDMSAWRDVVFLGGWDAETVSLAYATLGNGRVWLVNVDWQDNDEQITAESRALMASMIAWGDGGGVVPDDPDDPPPADCEGDVFGGVCVNHVSENCVRDGSARAYCRERGERLITFAELRAIVAAGWRTPQPDQFHTLAVDEYEDCPDDGVGNVAAPGWRADFDFFRCGDSPGYCRRAMVCVADAE